MTLSRLYPRDRSRPGSSADWLWGGFGVSLASMSASFAAYMIATAPAEVTGSGSKDWKVFVHLDHHPTMPTSADRRTPDRPPLAAAAAAIDPEPTGSIDPAATRPDPTPTGTVRVGRTTPLRDFILHDVTGSRALVEHRNKLSLVKPGSILDEAGEVLAIERRGDAWIVKTAGGIIGGR